MMKGWKLSSKIRHEYPNYHLFSIGLEVLTSTIRQEKEIEGIHTRKGGEIIFVCRWYNLKYGKF